MRLATIALVVSAGVQANNASDELAAALTGRPKGLPAASRKYNPARFTQRIAVTNGADTIEMVAIKDLPDSRWHQSGGMEGMKFTSEKFKLIPGGREREWIGNISVLNSLGYYQDNRGLRRDYPEGTRFDDVLRNASGTVFEHRMRQVVKDSDGKLRWVSKVLYTNVSARPEGYSGLKVTCAECHDKTGTGGYAVGLVPGGDGVFSDPFDWSLVERR